jgi:hypothetical protein
MSGHCWNNTTYGENCFKGNEIRTTNEQSSGVHPTFLDSLPPNASNWINPNPIFHARHIETTVFSLEFEHITAVVTKRYILCWPPASLWYLEWLIYRTWRWKWRVPPKCRVTFKRLRGVASHKTELSVTPRCENLKSYKISFQNNREQCYEFGLVCHPVTWPKMIGIVRHKRRPSQKYANFCCHIDAERENEHSKL